MQFVKTMILGCALLASVTRIHATEARKTVVLTFDDACKSHATVVAPLLKKHGFNATFLSPRDSRLNPKKISMTWEEIKKLHDQGFEIGNHTKRHRNMKNMPRQEVQSEIEHIEEQCRKVGMPKPVSFAYPGYHWSETLLNVLKDRGYTFARTGGGRASHPNKEDPLLLPDVLCPGPKTTFEELKKAADKAGGTHIPISTFHGVPDSEHKHVTTNPELFKKFVEYLQDNNFNVIALRDYPIRKTPKTEPARAE